MAQSATMEGVHLVGHGGLDMLQYRQDIPRPVPGPDEVLIRVAAAGVNNTDINTRIGWYSKAYTGSTNDAGVDGIADLGSGDAAWTGASIAFPRIQGADCCGQIVDVGRNCRRTRIGERVIVQSLLRSYVQFQPFTSWTLGSECDGAFAQYTVAPDVEAHAIDSDWTDIELASIPCAYSTAENMLHRAGVHAERVLITGASGGVGSAAVQLARRRGAHVTAVTSVAKKRAVLDYGANSVVDRSADLLEALGPDAVDVVIDVVGGSDWPVLLDVLTRGGRYVTSGAIAGPCVDLDLRTLYLRDLTLFGCTVQDDSVFTNLVSYIERNEIRPLVARVFPLDEIRDAQRCFLDKTFVGKIVLVPPPDDAAACRES